jgi:hypothetical protein
VLPTVKCSRGNDVNDARPEEKALTASSFEDCHRICSCGIAYSNADTAHRSGLTKIYSDPFAGLPSYLADDCPRVLNTALNERNRPTKKKKFCFSTSEDHVTWTIFQFLRHEGFLASTFERLGVVEKLGTEPDLLLWGVPIPEEDQDGWALRKRIEQISTGLHESSTSRSEPDVILSFGKGGLVFIEVKLGSRNEHQQPEYRNWGKYLKNSGYFVDPDQAQQSGLYELVRNWRIACECGEGRPVTVVNLGPQELFEPPYDEALKRLENSLDRKTRRIFRRLWWDDFFRAVHATPDWLRAYIEERKVVKPIAEDHGTHAKSNQGVSRQDSFLPFPFLIVETRAGWRIEQAIVAARVRQFRCLGPSRTNTRRR